MPIIYHNGEFKDDTQPVLSIHDRLRLGEGVFNTMLVVDGHIYHADRHMGKLLKNSELFLGKWDAPGADELIETAQGLLRKNDYMEGRFALNTVITVGEGGNGIRTPKEPKPQILMRALPCPSEFPPIKAIIAQSVRRNEGSPLSNIKCSNYGDNILALREAESKAANDAILLNNAGHISTSTVATIVAIIEGELITPPLADGPQDGITRSILMEKYTVREKSIRPSDLIEVEGLYFLNSLRGAMPVLALDGRAVPKPSLEIPQFFHLD